MVFLCEIKLSALHKTKIAFKSAPWGVVINGCSQGLTGEVGASCGRRWQAFLQQGHQFRATFFSHGVIESGNFKVSFLPSLFYKPSVYFQIWGRSLWWWGQVAVWDLRETWISCSLGFYDSSQEPLPPRPAEGSQWLFSLTCVGRFPRLQPLSWKIESCLF